MAIPDFQNILLPLLDAVNDGEEHHLNEVIEKLAQYFKLSEEDLREQYPSGNDNIFRNRIRFARSYLVRTGLLEHPRRGYIKISPSGLEALKRRPTMINNDFLKTIPGAVLPSASEEIKEISGNSQLEDPFDLLETGYQSIRGGLIQEILELVRKSPPHFFEKLVVELLLKMGYGGFAAGAGRVIGQTGDGGIDGIIKQDKLGLDVVYIQAKRWENAVGEPVIRDFVGSLVRHNANKGVIVTASHFSSGAQEYVKHIPHRVILIDGELLAQFMIDSNIGVSKITNYEIKKADLDYFSED